MVVSIGSNGSPASISICVWRSRNSLCARACATSKPVFARNPPSSTIWVSAARLPATPWPMPMRCATGASMPSSPNTLLQSRRIYADDPMALELDETVYPLDSTPIDLFLSVFPWAPFRSTKAAVKLHTLLDLRGNIPSFIFISDGKMHDVNILDQLVPEAGAFYVMDRGYVDFERLERLDDAGSFFVTRAKSNLKARRRYSRSVDRSTGLVCDQTVVLTGFYSRPGVHTPLRRIKFNDPQTGKRLVFLTNNFALDALTIAKLYKCRWQVELFFKWIKQHLRIKAFFGTSENAVKSQIWIAVSVYVLVAIVKKRLALPASLYEMLQILSLTLFEKTPINGLFDAHDHQKSPDVDPNQLNLFD